jgi:putative holliday junction resolvase
MRALALDVGTRTIGLAVSDPDGIVATAWETVARRGEAADVTELLTRIEARAVGRVVVGLPLELDGREGHRARRVLRLVEALRERLQARPGAPVEVLTWDERFSTAAAERALLEADVSRKRRKAKIDAVAAQLILQGWLDARRPSAPEATSTKGREEEPHEEPSASEVTST